MTIHEALLSRDDIDRLYVSRKEGGRGLASTEDSVDTSIDNTKRIKKPETTPTIQGLTELEKKKKQKRKTNKNKRQISERLNEKTLTSQKKKHLKWET